MSDAITTTLANIRKHSLRADGYNLLCKSLGGCKAYGSDTPITFRQIYESNGYSDTLWCLRTVSLEHDNLIRHFTVDCAEQVKHLMTDQRSIDALDVARRHADGLATDEELKTAHVAARAATRAARVAADADAAAEAAAEAAAWAATRAAGAAGAATRSVEGAARAAADAAQMQLLFEYCRTGERVMQKETAR